MVNMQILERNSSKGLSGATDLPLNPDVMFTDHNGKYNKSIEKNQMKIMGKISKFLKPFLKSDEKILYVCQGMSPMTFWEIYFTGWLIYYIKRAVLVFTDKRIFQIPVKGSFNPRNIIANIHLGDLKKIELKFGAMILSYKNEKNEKFTLSDRRGRKKISALIPNLNLTGEGSSQMERVHLCPRCTKELIKDKYVCPSCQFKFKSMEKAKKLSILYPGGGYFYTKHPFMGVSDAIAELFLTALVLAGLVGVIMNKENAFMPLVFGSILLIIEKLVTIFHAKHFVKEFIPEDKI